MRRRTASRFAHRDTDADFTMVVGKHYIVDISAWSNSGNGRTWTLPTSFKVGQRIAITLEVGDDTEHLAYTAGAGDNCVAKGESVAGGTEISRLFITGETIVFRAVTADSLWIVEHDGRIPQAGCMYQSVDVVNHFATALTFYKMAADTSVYDVGGIVDLSGDQFTVRRAGKYYVSGTLAPGDAIASTEPITLGIYDGTDYWAYDQIRVSNASPGQILNVQAVADLAAGDSIHLRGRFHVTNNVDQDGNVVYKHYCTEIL